MMNDQLKYIVYEYANTKGVGIPLTAEEMLNAISSWLLTGLPENIETKTETAAEGESANVTLTGNGTSEKPYIFTFTIPTAGAGFGFSNETAFTFEPVSITYADSTAKIVGNLNVVEGSNDITSEFTLEIPIIGENGINIDVDETGKKIVISSEVTEPVAIQLSGSSGTLTTEQLSTLEASVSNYIIIDNEIYTLADNENVSGYYTYTHVGMTNTQQYFIKCVSIIISTRGWALSTISVGQKNEYIAHLYAAATGSYSFQTDIKTTERLKDETDLYRWLNKNGYVSETHTYRCNGIVGTQNDQSSAKSPICEIAIGIFAKNSNLYVASITPSYSLKATSFYISDFDNNISTMSVNDKSTKIFQITNTKI